MVAKKAFEEFTPSPVNIFSSDEKDQMKSRTKSALSLKEKFDAGLSNL